MRRLFNLLSAASLLALAAATVSWAVVEQVNSAHARRRDARVEVLSERWYAIERDIRAVERAAGPDGGIDLRQREALTAQRDRAGAEQARLIASTPRQRIVTSVPELVAAVAWVLPACWLAAWGVRRIWPARHLPSGLCPACGYDLRASPGRCPASGTLAAVRGTP